jgi:hypothetical protein
LCFHAKLPAKLAFVPYPWASSSDVFLIPSFGFSKKVAEVNPQLATNRNRQSDEIPKRREGECVAR